MFKLALQAIEAAIEIQIDVSHRAIVYVLSRGTVCFRFEDASYDWAHIQDLLNYGPRFKNRVTATAIGD